MMIPMGELLAKAKKEGYGVAAPNVFNRETIEACFLAAKKLRAPIILDVAAVHGIYECADIARYYETVSRSTICSKLRSRWSL